MCQEQSSGQVAPKKPSAIVILSGGQDSTTTLFWAKQNFESLVALSFDYKQRHQIELVSADKVARLAGVEHRILELPKLFGDSPLVSDNPVGLYKDVKSLPGGVEPTFIWGRNILFLTVAASFGASREMKDIATGVCQADYGGYPDCRRIFVDAMCDSLSLGLYGRLNEVNIHTPLMNLTKADSVRLAREISGAWEALAWTHTCYQGLFPPCGHCHACLIRSRGFEEAGLPDPLLQRAEGVVTREESVSGTNTSNE